MQSKECHMAVESRRIAELAEKLIPVAAADLKIAAWKAGIDPREYVGHHATDKENAITLAQVAASKGEHCFNLLEKNLPDRIGHTGGYLRPLDQKIVLKFGQLLGDLITALEEFDVEDIPSERDATTIRRLSEKLNSAEIRGVHANLATRCRNQISVIRRQAERLGYTGYDKVQLHVQKLFVHIVEPRFPRPDYTPWQQSQELVHIIYDHCVPDKYKDNDYIDELLLGVVFDTVAHCVIEW